jgi:hypothetical protein
MIKAIKFKKKPVIIEAVQFTQYDRASVKGLQAFAGARKVKIGGIGNNKLLIKTLEGEMTANVGDWIIKGVKGEVYPCKPDIFELTYEAV